MKRTTILLFTLSVFLSSCSTAFYQIYKVTPDNSVQSNKDALIYEDESCIISYDLWAENGNIGFNIFNKTEQNIYLNMEESFFILNGIAYPYFQNRTYSSSTGSGTPATSELTYLSLITGTIPSAPEAGSSTITYIEERFIIIPPLKSRIINEYSINNLRIINCDLLRAPTAKQVKTVHFNDSSTPISFGNVINYSVGNSDPVIIENAFYISDITNYPESEIIETRYDETCGERDSEYTKVFTVDSPDRFYIKYTNTGFSKY